MGEITVSAEAPPAGVTPTITVTAEDIKAQNARTVAEALATATGIRVSAGRKNEPNVAINGFGQSKILVLIDGVPYYETNYGKLDLNQIPTDNIARLEVTKGTASVLYGANAMGGVINIVTKKAGDKPFTGISVEAGENNLGQAVLTHGRKLGAFNYWLSLTHLESDGWNMSGDYDPYVGKISRKSPSSTTYTVLQDSGRRVNSDVEKNDAWFKIGYENGPDSAYWVNLHYLEMAKGNPPATDAVSVFLNRPRFSQFSRIPTYLDRGIDFDLLQRLDERLVLKGKLFYHNHQDDYDSYAGLKFDEKMSRSTFKDFLTGGSVILESPISSQNTVRMSLNYKIDSHRERDDTYLPFARTQSRTGSIGVEDEVRFGDKTRAVFGVSDDRFQVRAAQRNILDKSGNFIRQDPLEKPSANFLNPMAGVTYQVSKESLFYASVARKSRFPLLQNLFSSKNGNIDLKPERSTNFTAGYNTLLAPRLRLEVSGFWYETSDLISRSGVDPTNLYQNFGKIRTRGIELGATFFASPSFRLYGDFTYIDGQDRSDGRVTEAVIDVPKHKAGLGFHWQFPWLPLHIDFNSYYLSQVFTSLPSPKYPTDPTYKIGCYALTNTRIGLDIGTKFELWLAVRNLADVNYEMDYGYPGPGQAVSVGLTAKM